MDVRQVPFLFDVLGPSVCMFVDFIFVFVCFLNTSCFSTIDNVRFAVLAKSI